MRFASPKRSDFADITELYSLVVQLGVDRVGIADTLDSATPMEVFNKVSRLPETVSCDIETHFHNDTGCAVANAYCALEAGTTHVDTTVLGIGERNGIAPLGGLMQCLLMRDRKHIMSKYKIDKLGHIDDLVAKFVEVEIPFNNCNLYNLSPFVPVPRSNPNRPLGIVWRCDLNRSNLMLHYDNLS